MKFGQCTSDIFKVPSGVPQGGHYSSTLFNLVMNLAPGIMKDSKMFLYADDSKIVKRVFSISDCLVLQDDCNRFNEWCRMFGMKLNSSKCKSMTLSRSRNKLNSVYYIGDNRIDKINKFRDLGITFNNKFDFNDDLTFRLSKAKSTLGVIKRLAPDFKNIDALKTLYVSLVRSTLEYGSVVWSPYYSGPTTAIENVQRSFLRFIDFENNLNYDTMCNKFKLDKLCTRRKISSIMFCFDLLTGKIDCPELLSKVNFHCPIRFTRHNEFLRPVRHTTNYLKYNPINVMQSNFNSVHHLFNDGISREGFRSKILYFLRDQN